MPVAPTVVGQTEAYETLFARARRKTGHIPADLIARHVLSVTRGADWPVQREAMEALLRRMAFAGQDRLRIATRPRGRGVFGVYTTRRRRASARPYHTLLESVDPPAGSCDCPDFTRNSLGLCKHLLVILNDIAARPRVFGEAGNREPAAVSPLRWDCVRPLAGEGDWLARVRWSNGAVPSGLRPWFRGGALRDALSTKPERRAALVADLLRALGDRRRNPGLHALLTRERERLERAIGGVGTAGLRTLKQKLYPYQRKGVERFLAEGRLLLADDMGLGKTAQAIAACHVLWKTRRARRILILVPASLKSQWLREFGNFSDIPVAIVEGGPDQRAKTFRTNARGVLIANYEQLLRDLDVIRRWDPDLVVLDEAQRIKNWATKTAMYVKTLRPRYRLVLTGTPMENRLDELASIVEWVDDTALEPKWRLLPWHTTPADGGKGIAGVRNLNTLRERLAPCMTRRLRQDVLDQLPPRTDTCVPVEMTPEQKEEHDSLNQPIIALMATAERRPLTQPEFLRLMQLLTTQRIISNGLAQLRFEEVWPAVSRVKRPGESVLRGLSSPKLLEIRELVERVALEQGRKMVIFSQWRRMLKLAHWAVQDLLGDAGARALFFTGAENQKRRTHNIVDFHDDPDARILFASDAGGVGLNLQRAANCCVNLELPWNPAVLEQRIGRIYRIGQTRPIDVYNLVCSEGIEAHIDQLVGTKRAFFTALFDGTSDEVAFEKSGTFLSRVRQVVGPVAAPKPEEVPEENAAQERELDEMVSAGDESRDREDAAPDMEGLFTGLKMRRTEKGGLVIEAPPETAATLAAVFQGMAKMLQQATAAPPSSASLEK